MPTATPSLEGWTLIETGPFEAMTGPLFRTDRDLGPDEPLRIGFKVETRHCNDGGVCHGGMIATFVDMAMGLSMRRSLGADGGSPTMTLTVDFLSAAAEGDWIESRSRVVHTTYRSGFCDVIALGPNGPVARGNAIFRLTRPKQA